jgi:Right handed beta helix region
MSLIRALAAALLCLPMLGIPAHAQISQAYLSVEGNDNWPCTASKPCRLLPAALNAVATGGQVWILDSGTFNTGTVTITKSVSIQAAPGTSAAVLAYGAQQGMIVNAPGAIVGLRNLTFTADTQGVRAEGLKISKAATVSVESCLFADLNLDSLVAINTAAIVHVADTTFRNVNGWSVAAWNGPTINVTNSRMHHTEGPFVFTTQAGITSTLSMSDSTISDGKEGVYVTVNTPGGIARAFLTRTTIYKTKYGLDVSASPGGSSLVTVSNSMITGNENAFVIGPNGTVHSLGNNHIADNAAEVGALTPVPQR